MERDAGGRAYPERPENARSFPVGDNVPTQGQAPSRTDEEIRRDVESALFYDKAVSSLGIQIQVQGGVVTLSGNVADDTARRVAGDLAARAPGVRQVRNELNVTGQGVPSRAAGQDMSQSKPPQPIYGEPPTQQGQAGQQRTAGQAGSSGQPQMGGQSSQSGQQMGGQQMGGQQSGQSRQSGSSGQGTTGG